jgi:predicted amidophosphoribosyltransferase
LRHRPPFRLRALARYEGAIREAIHLFKYEHKRILAKHFDRAIQARIARLRELLPVDAVLPVPLHRRRYRQRGFNQAALLANSVADALGLPLILAPRAA